MCLAVPGKIINISDKGPLFRTDLLSYYRLLHSASQLSKECVNAPN
jgi:hypothetical protein